MKKILLAIFTLFAFFILPNKVNAQVIDNVNAPNTQREIERALREECAGDVTCAAIAGQRYLASLGFSSRIEGDCSTFPGCTLVCDNGANVRISLPAPTPTLTPTRTPAPTSTPLPPRDLPCPPLPLGDVDGDGRISQNDVSKINDHTLGRSLLTVDQIERADVNGDGNINSLDVLKISQYLGNLINSSAFACPSPTDVPNACNVTCTRDADCTGNQYSNQNQCTVCLPDGSGNKICKVPPACNSSCVRDSDCNAGPALRDGCVACINNQCKIPPSPTPTPTNIPPPTATPTRAPTPTPVFNPDACKCDFIEYTDLFSGQSTTITAYSKVEGADIQRAKVVSTKFTLYKSVGGSVSGNPILAETVPATVVSSTPQLVRYKSVWNFTVPTLEKGADYRIGAVVNDAGTCQPKTTAFNTQATQTTSVLATETQNLSFLDRILNFFNGLFGGGRSTAPALTPTITPSTPADTTTSDVSVSAPAVRKQLQLEPIYPLEVYQKSCNFIKFRSQLN